MQRTGGSILDELLCTFANDLFVHPFLRRVAAAASRIYLARP